MTWNVYLVLDEVGLSVAGPEHLDQLFCSKQAVIQGNIEFNFKIVAIYY